MTMIIFYSNLTSINNNTYFVHKDFKKWNEYANVGLLIWEEKMSNNEDLGYQLMPKYRGRICARFLKQKNMFFYSMPVGRN